ncbi:MSC_0882 family membrane protein [Ureaplasma canigenitalium]|uniref:MSC_0882 family membrane protein n=1 Tax=Ureaplasma canigenitalium TaxID=42092 RepID=UPI0004E11C4F|nr:DUF4064 domain-containing protein [Ureaplasma canigenitalium]
MPRANTSVFEFDDEDERRTRRSGQPRPVLDENNYNRDINPSLIRRNDSFLNQNRIDNNRDQEYSGSNFSTDISESFNNRRYTPVQEVDPIQEVHSEHVNEVETVFIDHRNSNQYENRTSYNNHSSLDNQTYIADSSGAMYRDPTQHSMPERYFDEFPTERRKKSSFTERFDPLGSPLDPFPNRKYDSPKERKMMMKYLTEDNVTSLFKREMTDSKFKVSFWVMMFLAGVAGLCYFVHEVVVKNFNPWIFLPFIVYLLLMILFIGLSGSQLVGFKREYYRQKYGFESSYASTFITNQYRKMIVANINLNWGTGIVYLLSAVIILGAFVIAYLLNISNNSANSPYSSFGVLQIHYSIYDKNGRIIQEGINRNAEYAIYGICGILGLTFIIHILFGLYNSHRVNRITSFYEYPILDDEAELNAKKVANKRGLIIFIVITVILLIFFIVAYFILTAKRKGDEYKFKIVKE